MPDHKQDQDYGVPEVYLNDDMRNCLIVEGLPVVEAAKADKLVPFVQAKFAKFGPLIKENFYLPLQDGKTLGYCFMEFESVEHAQAALEGLNNTPMDKQHTFRISHYSEYLRLQDYSEQYQEPVIEEYQPKENVRAWLTDAEFRDQYVVRHDTETEVFWNDPLRGGRALDYGGEVQKSEGKVWTEAQVAWSPRGSYLLTFHSQGVQIWGGASWSKLGRFLHPRVQQIDFSPCERYLATFSGEEPESIVVWEVSSGKKLASFSTAYAVEKNQEWPYLKWSHDGQYVSRVVADNIEIYTTANMKLLDDKPMRVPNVRDACWSPVANILSYWVPEFENAPARVSLINIPSRTVLRDKHLVYVTDVKMHWQSEGACLMVQVSRQTKGPKGVIVKTTMLDIFVLEEKGVPVESFELKDNILAVSWEPKGRRFALIHSVEGSNNKNTVTIYNYKNKKFAIENAMEGRMTNRLYWSPAGNVLVLGIMGTSEDKTLEFYDATKKEILAACEHPLVTDVEWDPAGRFCTSIVGQALHNTSARYNIDNGYKVWNAKGKLVFTQMVDRCFQVLWRPRPPTLLSENQVKEIKRNALKDKYSKKFDDADDDIRQTQLTGVTKERRDLRDQWRAYREAKAKEFAALAKERAALRGYESGDEQVFEEVTEIVETEIDVKEEIMH